MTLGEWLETWLALYVDPSGLAETTKACYHRSVRAVTPHIASLDMRSLSPLDLMPWLVSVARKHPRAAQLNRVMLSKALKTGRKLGLCPACVLDQDTCPKPPHSAKETQILTIEQAAAYIRSARTSPCYPLLALCLCGLRRGEALGARWQDIQDGHLCVTRQRIRINRQYRVAPLKSKHSQRRLLLPEQLQHDLQVWPRTITGWLVDATPEQLHREHKRVLAAAQLPDVTLHGLRHTFASAAAEQGRPMKHLQLALGHSKIKLTADLYADHLSPLSSLPALVWQGFAM